MADVPFNHAVHDFYKPVEQARGVTDVEAWGPSLARQEFAEEADINVLMSRFPNQGILPPQVAPAYVDFTAFPDDLMGVMDKLHEATAAFMTLPANVRKEFDNDARVFVDFAADPANVEQMREWGLAPKEIVPAPPPVMDVRIVQGLEEAAGASEEPKAPPKAPKK